MLGTKKLKCAGEQPACSRCAREGITCVYSLQKQMGRPKKRQRSDEDVNIDIEIQHGHSSAQRNRDATMTAGLGTDRGANLGANTTALDLPWLSGQWETSVPPGEHAIPNLTPDSSSNSPPIFNIPPELQTHQGRTHHHRDPSTALLLDPTLSGGVSSSTASNMHGMSNLGCPPNAMPSCACLSAMYLTLNDLQTMDPTYAFPFALHPLREAMTTAAEVMACEECPTKFISAIQNTQMLGTLLMSIAERFSKILDSISTEAARAELVGESKKFRLAELNNSTSHLHTGGIGCAAAFSIDLSPAEWRSMCKKVVRAEVDGPADGNVCCPHLMGLTRGMRERQEKWLDKPAYPKDFPKDSMGNPFMGRFIPKEDHVCLKLAAGAEKLVEFYDWS